MVGCRGEMRGDDGVLCEGNEWREEDGGRWCCDWEKERWRTRGRGEEERRQRARKTGERDREMELRCVRWRGGSGRWESSEMGLGGRSAMEGDGEVGLAQGKRRR